MSDWIEKRNNLKQELAQLSEQELREKWQQNDNTLQEMEHEARERGYNTTGEDYFGSDLAGECEVINEILKARGLAEEERSGWPEEEEE